MYKYTFVNKSTEMKIIAIRKKASKLVIQYNRKTDKNQIKMKL